MKLKNQLLTARTEFASALNQICAERSLTPESVIETIKTAILAAYRKDYGIDEDYEYEVELEPTSGAAKVYQYKEDNKDKKKDITPPGFGRIAAQTAKQVILQKIREAEKDAILKEYENKVDTLVNGMVLRFEGKDIICDIGKGQGRMSLKEQVRAEKYHLNQRLTFYIKEIADTSKGRQIIVSRSDPKLVSLLFKREVPEVSSGAVEIKKVAREAGSRSKVAVVSTQAGVDPVGSCVGQKGVRVQAVIEELNGEKIDVIQYSDEPKKFISSALSPAEHLTIQFIDKEEEEKEKNKNETKKEKEQEEKPEKIALVKAPENQLSLAIGKDGQNVRLAAKLTGYKIDIKSRSEKSNKNTDKDKSKEQEQEDKKDSETKKAKDKNKNPKKTKQDKDKNKKEIKNKESKNKEKKVNNSKDKSKKGKDQDKKE